MPNKKAVVVQPELVEGSMGDGALAVPHPDAPPSVWQQPQHSLVDMTPASLRARLTEYDECRSVIMDWIRSHMCPGVDYMLIHRSLGRGENKRPCDNADDLEALECDACGAKARLVKPGAEKLCWGPHSLFRTTPHMERVTEYDDALASSLTLKEKGRGGVVVMRCRLLARDGSEVSQALAARSIDREWGDVNKALQMCEVRAFIAAVVRYGLLSEVFTPDFDEERPEIQKPRRKAEPKGKRGKPAPPPEPKGDEKISAAQLKRLHAIGTEAEKRGSITRHDIKEYLKGRGYESSKDILARDYDTICNWISADGSEEPK